LPEVNDAVFKLDTRKVAEQTDFAAAFEMLVAAPLQGIARPIVLVIDALDEADPPEQFESDFAGKCVKACGNKMLVLLRRHLAALGPNVRFIITTRPDAVCGGVRGVLERTFDGSVQFVLPTQLRPHVEGAGAGVMVYITVVKECKLPTCRLQQPTIEDVYALYDQVFSRDTRTLASELQAAVRELVALLLVVQEPMSQSTLYEMGFGQLLEALPGWGALFFVHEHKVFMLHKSLADWLRRRDTLVGGSPLDLPKGHEQLARHLGRGRAAPSPYTTKYLVFHLVSAVRSSTSARELMDEVLQDMQFLSAVARAAHLSRVVQSLGSLRAEEHTSTSEDVNRWLSLAVNELDGTATPSVLVGSVWKYCPTSSFLFKLPSIVGPNANILCGRATHWGAQRGLFQVRLGGGWDVHPPLFTSSQSVELNNCCHLCTCSNSRSNVEYGLGC